MSVSTPEKNEATVKKVIGEYVSAMTTKKMLEDRISILKESLTKLAELKDGCATGHISDGQFRVKIQKKTNETWDQEKLRQMRDILGAEKFGAVFRAEYYPQNKKTLDGAIAVDPELKKAVEWARTIKEATPQVSYEPVNTEPSEAQE